MLSKSTKKIAEILSEEEFINRLTEDEVVLFIST